MIVSEVRRCFRETMIISTMFNFHALRVMSDFCCIFYLKIKDSRHMVQWSFFMYAGKEISFHRRKLRFPVY